VHVNAPALKKHGMFLADGGNLTFKAATDALTAHKWSAVGVDASSLKSLSWSDFEVVDLVVGSTTAREAAAGPPSPS
jgi:hypothetical protein